MASQADSGFIVVDKPVGATSFSIVALVRRLTGARRVGHAGTLDPLASGVLPVAVGYATRLIEYLDDELKTYSARLRFGETTDTYDAEGKVTARADASHLTGGAVEGALAGFVGDIEQTPPLYSALKVAGRPLYRYAREGADIAVHARTVRVESILLRSFAAGVAEFEVRCGKGTYIRSLAHDVGQALGCGAHLSALTRTSTGGFSIERAHTPDALHTLAVEGRLGEALLAPDRAVERRLAAILAAEHSADVLTGRDVRIDAHESAALCRAYSSDGEFLGMLRRREGGLWHPAKVVAAP